jgi:predicted RNA binding protein YcfA (HicA-like mRNA interferase family)
LAKRKVLSGKDICEILERNGFREVRRRGSHIVMQKRSETSTITVPVPDHAELKPGTMASIIRQSGLDKKTFQ